ncbi:MAG: hypothetical protein NWE83_04460 [Candidatus Bathyarchaeota archaeon]|nr:hypothetical protein [Candidatus Bathyarchaeota archaeon]
MPANIFRQKRQVRKSDLYDDSILPGQTELETNSTDLETDLNSIRSQIKRILSAVSGNWYDDLNITNLKQRGIKELNEDLNAVETILDFIDQFTPTASQTVFTLTHVPININLTKVFINGQKIKNGRDYFISGTSITIILDYNLDSGDDLEIYYLYQA